VFTPAVIAVPPQRALTPRIQEYVQCEDQFDERRVMWLFADLHTVLPDTATNKSILAIVDGAESITKEDFPERAWGGVGEESLMHELNARGRLHSR